MLPKIQFYIWNRDYFRLDLKITIKVFVTFWHFVTF